MACNVKTSIHLLTKTTKADVGRMAQEVMYACVSLLGK